MKFSLIKNGIFILLVEVMFMFKFNLGGEISIGEFALIIWFIFFYRKLVGIVFWKSFFHMYLFLLSAQLFSELFVSNGLNDSMRGIMVTIISFFHLSFLLFYASKDKRFLLFAFIGAAISILMQKMDEDVSMDVIESGEAAAYVKMRIAPAVGYFIMTASVFVNKKICVIAFSAVGALIILLGARSGGMFIFVSGIFGYYLSLGKKISIKSKIPAIVIAVAFLYVGYCYYATEVLEGRIVSGNNEQILSMSNPYNPLELLYVGRGEFFIGVQAFIDRFWLGFGAWAKDETGHYWDLLYKMKGLDTVWHGVWLPVHSVLIGWGVYNGVLCFIAGSKIVIFTLKKSFLIFKYNLYDKRYMSCILYCLISFLWNLLFSPPSHFRYTLPLLMVPLLMFKIEKYDK